MNQLFRYGYLLVVLGLLIIFIGLYIDGQFNPHERFVVLVLKLLDEAGIALFLAGTVGILLELPDWRDYFQRELAKIIVDQAYLNKMNNDQLIALQTNTLKAFFKTADIDRKDSLLHYYYSRIHQHIGSPYRESANDVINIRYRNGGDEVEVEETVSYRCRKVGGRIQANVRWLETGAVQIKQMQLTDHWVEIRVPSETFRSPTFAVTNKAVTAESRRFTRSEMPAFAGGEKIGFEMLLADYAGIDDLHVRSHVKYTMPVNMPFTWAMSHPTKGVLAVVNYPSDLELTSSLFGLTDDQVSAEARPGFYQVEYDSWLLPDTGLAFQLMRKRESAPGPTAAPHNPS